ncbi:hypothetical protein GCM10009738_79190 [Kitasatospora viridis]|uniref:Uncharacterized protein n=2 Tax=Kitasatospora viridis TaxID=281105 RepID=A0A561UC61_9ACTN|nr:hypothetical protein FHX73_11725 [Kitasatospora viridis]
MGVPSEDWEHLFKLTSDAFGAGDALTRRFAHLDIMSYFEKLQSIKAADPGDDLVSVLATAEIDGKRLSPERSSRTPTPSTSRASPTGTWRWASASTSASAACSPGWNSGFFTRSC